jgi:hypothetical protein
MSVAEGTQERSSLHSTRAGQLAIVLAVLLALVLGWWLFVGRHQAVPSIVEGWATPNIDGTAIGLSSERGGEEEGYIIAGAMWSDGLSWRDGSHLPTCIGDDPEVTTRVRMGVVSVDNGPVAPSPANTVVWIECLSN